MLGNMKFGDVVHKLRSQTMFWTRVPFREYFGHTRATNFQTNENLGLHSIFHGLITFKQCDFNQKNIHFGSVVNKLCPKTPKFCWFGAKWDWPITSQETTFWVMWVLFMDLEHQNNVICTFRHPFWVYGSGLLTNCFRTRNGSNPRKMWVS